MRYFQLILLCLFVNQVSAAPYIERDDPLFELVSKLRTEKSRSTLKELADNGNADAAYWYAASIGRKNIIEHAKSYDYFKQAADEGNPYAMLRISGKVGRPKYDCKIIGWPCDSEWKDKGIEKLIELKEQGDIKAYYYYNKYSGTIFYKLNPFTDYMSEEEMVIYAAKRDYYTPLISYISHRTKKPEEVDDEIIAVLDKAASKGFSPALYYRGDSFNRGLTYEQRIQLLQKAAHNGYVPSYSAISYLARKKNNDYITAYTYLYLEYLVTGNKPSFINNSPQGLYQFQSLSEHEIKKGKEKAEELSKKVEPEIFFDEGDFFSTTGMTKYR
ncbi:hypothetical protein ACMXYX_04665 [Neptuniibacter sp. QD72_48]|uniref:hypothetical protein n=1 Tax=Neptuniibacter sp. QD72_48 TaxID=3398214 RepID=UPI0039F55B95